MSEYLVTFKATIPTWFGLSSQSRTEARVYSGKTAEEATKTAKLDLKEELRKEGIFDDDLEDRGITVTIIDVKKI